MSLENAKVGDTLVSRDCILTVTKTTATTVHSDWMVWYRNGQPYVFGHGRARIATAKDIEEHNNFMIKQGIITEINESCETISISENCTLTTSQLERIAAIIKEGEEEQSNQKGDATE